MGELNSSTIFKENPQTNEVLIDKFRGILDKKLVERFANSENSSLKGDDTIDERHGIELIYMNRERRRIEKFIPVNLGHLAYVQVKGKDGVNFCKRSSKKTLAELICEKIDEHGQPHAVYYERRIVVADTNTNERIVGTILFDDIKAELNREEVLPEFSTA